MKVFKFGGVSVKDADGVKNVAKVLENQGYKDCLIIVSAIGKTTNALEKVVKSYFDKGDYSADIEKVKQEHLNIAQGLFPKNHLIFEEIEHFFEDMNSFLRRNKSPNYNFVYDQIVTCGELISSKILSHYLSENQLNNEWIDARDFIKTDSSYREGIVNWELTEKNISQLDSSKTYITQGFIGTDENNFTVSLGREGSDYSAAIFAYCLNATDMTIWKDVPGVMTGDPRKFQNVQQICHISYEEAIEMAYYGASIIHPKTLQPLKQKHIPFFVKSFINPENSGTKIGVSEKNQQLESYILKENQNLMHIATRDFSFIAEDHMSYIFGLLAKHNIKVSLMQNSAISLALCLEDKFNKVDELVSELRNNFNTEICKNVSLFTVRNAQLENLEKIREGKTILLEQISKTTIQMVIN
ncbi:MAG: aspartate kinase [Flavobacteriaceae bacterium]|nr:aspartate kinase [Flavobacteriaceae bacterium]